MSNAKRSLGTSIAIGVTAIGELTEIMSPELTAEEIDVTTLGSTSGYREYVQGFLDSGTLDISGFFYPGDAGQAALKTAFDAGTTATFTITYPAAVGATWVFEGFVTKFKGGDATIEDPLTFECSIRITGATVLGTTASTGVSAATFVQTDGSTPLTATAITPTFAIGTLLYGFTFTTQTSFKPKITAASHTIKLYVDGVFVENLTSGTSGTAIAIGAAATKEIKALVYEAGKTPKTYTFMVSRLS